MTYFGKNLKTLISKLALSQARIESVVDKRQTTISNWINGKSNPDAEDLVKLADFFGFSIDDLCLTDLSESDIIGEDYISEFKAKGRANGKRNERGAQSIGESTHIGSGTPEGYEVLLWSILKVMKGIDQKLDQLKADMKQRPQNQG